MIPESSSYYTLVALVHHRAQKTATAGDFEPGGHYTSILRHIGSKHILFYDDAANNAIIREASAKAAAELGYRLTHKIMGGAGPLSHHYPLNATPWLK